MNKDALRLGAKSTAQKNQPIDTSKVEPALLNKKDRRRYRSPDRFMDVLTKGATVISTALVILIGTAFLNFGNTKLPSPDEVYNNLDTMGIGTEIVTKLDHGGIARFHTDGSPIKIGISEDFTDEEEQVIRQVIAKYNNVFSVINPDYKFVIDEDGTSTAEKLDSNYIMVSPTGSLQGNAVAYEQSGAFPTINGWDTIYNRVYMGADSRENINMFRNTFLHEFMHALGVADAYLVQGWYEDTIMNCTASWTKTNDIYPYDVALLAALYGDFSTPENVERIKNFVAGYGAGSSYTDTSHYKYKKSNLNKTQKAKTEEVEEGLTF